MFLAPKCGLDSSVVSGRENCLQQNHGDPAHPGPYRAFRSVMILERSFTPLIAAFYIRTISSAYPVADVVSFHTYNPLVCPKFRPSFTASSALSGGRMGWFHGSMADIDPTLKLLCLSMYCRNTVAVKAQSESASDACSR